MKMKQKKPSVIPPTAPAVQPLSYQYHDFLLDRQPELLDALRRDATAGRANAQYLMGMMYAEGHHLPQDTELALHWLERAAKQGHLDAQLDLGLLCLESGDAEGGRQWLIIAGAGGSVQAQYQLFRYYFEGQYGAPDYSQAMEWLEWAAQGGVVIIMSYVLLSEPEISAHEPKVVLVDEANRIREVIRYEPANTVL